MAAIQLTTKLNLDDSQFKNKTREVLDFVQTLSKTKAYISPKLKFDTGDVRKELQSALTEAYRQLEKAYGVKKGEKLAYAGPKGGIRTVNTKDQQKRAIEYFSNRMDDKSLSQVERNQAERIVSAHRAYNDLIRQIQDLDRRARKAFTRSLDVDDEKLRAEEFKQFTRTNRRGKNIAATKEAIEEARTAVVRRGTITSFYPDNLKNYGQEIKALQDLIAKKKELFRQEGRGRYYTDQEVKDARARIDALRQEKAAREQAAKANKEQLQYNKTVFDASVKRRKEATNAEKQAQRAADKNADIQNRIIKQYQQQYGILGGLGSRLRNYLSIYALANFGKKVAETTGYFEKQQVALEGILGSASKAQSVLSQIKDFALHSPFQTKELVTFTKQLAAFSIPADQLFDTTKRLADISAGLGVDMSRIILAYGQVRSAAVLRGQELRQFTEAGIPLVQKLAEKFTQLRGEVVTTADVFELISKRQVSFQMVSDVLNDMTKEGGQFYKMQENITDALYGQMQKLQDMWTIKMDEMGKGSGSFLMNVVKLLQLIVKNANGVTAALLSAFALDHVIRSIRVTRMEWTLLTAEQKASLKTMQNFRKLRLIEFGKNLGWGIGAAAVGAGIGALYQWYRKLGEVQRKMDEVSTSFNKETNKMVSGFDDLVQRLRSARQGTQAYNDAISTLKSNYGEFVNVNDETIQTLLSEQKAIDGSVTEFQKLRDEIAAAIKLKQKFNELKTQKETLGDLFSGNAEGSNFWGTGYKGVNERYLNQLGSIVGGMNTKTGSVFMNQIFGTQFTGDLSKKFIDELNALANETLVEYRNKNYTSQDEFDALYAKNFQNRYLQNTLGTWNNKQIDDFISNVSKAIFATFGDTKEFDAYKDVVAKINGEGTDLVSMMARINAQFDSYNPKENTGVGAVGMQQWTNTKYAELLRNSVIAEFGFLGGDEEKLNALKNTLNTFVNSEVYDEGGIKKITEDLKAFLDTIKDAERHAIVSDAKKRFEEGVDALTNQEAKIANRIDAAATWAGINRGVVNNVNLQGYIDNYNPAALGEQTVQQTRDKIRSAYDDLRKELKTYTDVENSANFAEDIALINAKMRVLERLAKKDLYDVDLTEKGKKGGAGGGWRRLFSDLFGYIKEARAEEKKLIEHSAGNTKALAEQIGSEQLAGTAVRAFWDGTPFGKFINKMDEYGLESDVFSNDFLKEELGNIVSQMLEETDTIDYKDVWEKLIAVIRDRKDALKGDKKMESTVDAMENYLAQMVMEQEKFFGRLDVEQFIKDQINTMNRINANVEAIRTRRDLFGKIAGSSNYLAAQAAIYDTAPYRTYLNSETTRNQIMRLMGEGIGSGVSATNSGIAMWQLLQGGNMNIANLGELVRIIEELRNEISDMNPSDYEAMKGSLSQFDGLIKQLMNDIINEFEELMRFKDPITSGMDDIVNAFKSLNDAMTRINAGEGNGTLTQGQANRMRINALQAMYQTVSGVNIPSYITTLFGAMNNNGISGNGLNMASWLSDNPAVANFGRQQAALLQEEQKEIEDYYDNAENFVGMTDKQVQTNKNRDLQNAAEKAAEAVKKFAERIEITTKIIDKVDSYVQQASKAANDILDAIESTNGLVRDNNGNYSYEMDLEQARNSVNLISQFSSDLSDSLKSFVTGDIFGGLMGLVSMITNFFKNIVTMSEKPQRDKQQQLIASNKALERALNNLQHAIDDVAGKDKWDNLFEQIKNLRDQQSNLNAAADIEEGFKHGDAEKAESLRDQAEEAGRQAEDIIRGIREEILGTADELAQSLTDAFVDAFQNGKNAAREWRDTVRGYISQMLKDNLLEKVLGSRIQDILGSFGIGEGSTADSIIKTLSDADKMTDLRNSLDAEGTWMTNWFNSLPKAIQEMIGWNSSTSELSGGIQSITEDTGRTLEGLANSMLAQMIIANRNTESISGITQAQLGELKTIRVQAEAIAKASGIIQGILEGSRDGTRYLHVQMH